MHLTFRKGYTYPTCHVTTCRNRHDQKKVNLFFTRATYMMENCEARNAELRQNLNTTLQQLNTTGLNPQQLEWLKGNTTNNVTSGLQKCDIQDFLSDVGVTSRNSI